MNMKLLNFTFLIVLMNFFFCACKQENTHVNKTVIKQTKIAGKIINLENDSLISLYYFDLGLGQITKNIKVDKSGNFKTDLTLPYPQSVQIKYKGHFSSILSPGDSLFIELDEKQNKHIKFRGDIAVTNLNNENLQYKEYWTKYYWKIYADLENKASQLTPDKYKKLAFTYKNELLDSITSFSNKNKVSQKFKNYATSQIKYKIGEFLLDAPLKYCSKNKMNPKDVVPLGYYDFTDSIVNNLNTVNSIKFAPSENFYVKYIASLMQKNTDKVLIEKGGYLELCEYVFNDISLLKNKDLVTLLTSRVFVKSFKDGAPSEIFKIHYPKYGSNISNEYYKKKVDSIIGEVYKTITLNANIADKDKLIELRNNKQLTSLIDSILQTDKKYIYVDIWATWCKPCIGEFPFSKKLHKQTSSNVKFVYLCMGSLISDWQEAKTKFNLSGEQYFLNEIQTKYLRETLGVYSYPRYFLLNDKGEIIDINMSRPSDPKTLERLIK